MAACGAGNPAGLKQARPASLAPDSADRDPKRKRPGLLHALRTSPWRGDEGCTGCEGSPMALLSPTNGPTPAATPAFAPRSGGVPSSAFGSALSGFETGYRDDEEEDGKLAGGVAGFGSTLRNVSGAPPESALASLRRRFVRQGALDSPAPPAGLDVACLPATRPSVAEPPSAGAAVGAAQAGRALASAAARPDVDANRTSSAGPSAHADWGPPYVASPERNPSPSRGVVSSPSRPLPQSGRFAPPGATGRTSPSGGGGSQTLTLLPGRAGVQAPYGRVVPPAQLPLQASGEASPRPPQHPSGQPPLRAAYAAGYSPPPLAPHPSSQSPRRLSLGVPQALREPSFAAGTARARQATAPTPQVPSAFGPGAGGRSPSPLASLNQGISREPSFAINLPGARSSDLGDRQGATLPGLDERGTSTEDLPDASEVSDGLSGASPGRSQQSHVANSRPEPRGAASPGWGDDAPLARPWEASPVRPRAASSADSRATEPERRAPSASPSRAVGNRYPSGSPSRPSARRHLSLSPGQAAARAASLRQAAAAAAAGGQPGDRSGAPAPLPAVFPPLPPPPHSPPAPGRPGAPSSATPSRRGTSLAHAAARLSPLAGSPLRLLGSPYDPSRGTPDRDADGFTLHSQPAYERVLRVPAADSPSSIGGSSPMLAAWWSGQSDALPPGRSGSGGLEPSSSFPDGGTRGAHAANWADGRGRAPPAGRGFAAACLAAPHGRGGAPRDGLYLGPTAGLVPASRAFAFAASCGRPVGSLGQSSGLASGAGDAGVHPQPIDLEPRPSSSSCLGAPDRAGSAADSACTAPLVLPGVASQSALGDLADEGAGRCSGGPSDNGSDPAATALEADSGAAKPGDARPRGPSSSPVAGGGGGGGSARAAAAGGAAARRRASRCQQGPFGTPRTELVAQERSTPLLDMCAPIGVASDSTRKLFPIFKPKRDMKSLYIIRHGESEFNAGTTLGSEEGGDWDDPNLFDARLTAKGEREAEELGLRLADLRIPLDALWVTSPLCRAVQTMLIAAASMRRELERRGRCAADDGGCGSDADDGARRRERGGEEGPARPIEVDENDVGPAVGSEGTAGAPEWDAPPCLAIPLALDERGRGGPLLARDLLDRREDGPLAETREGEAVARPVRPLAPLAPLAPTGEPAPVRVAPASLSPSDPFLALPLTSDPAFPLPESVAVCADISEKLVTTGDVGRVPAELTAEFPCLAPQLAALPDTWWFSRPEKPNCASAQTLGSLEPQRNVLRRIGGFKAWLGRRPESVVVAFGHSSYWEHFCAGYNGIRKERMKNCEIRRLQV